MGDMVWIGNTLYPRWFVFGTPIAILLAVTVFVVVVQMIASRLSRPKGKPPE